MKPDKMVFELGHQAKVIIALATAAYFAGADCVA